VNSVNVSVRVTNVLADRHFAICVDGCTRQPWVIEVDVARRLHQELGHAIDAVGHLRPERDR
jgi:hypothetical protein